MAEKARCELCARNFKDVEGLAAHNKAKHPDRAPKERKPLPIKKIRNLGIFIVVISLIIFGIYWGISSVENLPPTDMQRHIEVSPESHVLEEPMPLAVQKHMLEHVDGIEGGKGGVIINYNCKNYECEENLIGKLESFASEFDYVYVAPFKGMDAKIAITRLGKIDVLEEYDETRIRNFVEGR